MAKYGSGPSKSDVANNVAGWDLVGFDSGKSGGSSSGSTSSGSSRGSSGSSGGSDNDGGGRDYYTDTAGWGGGSKSGPNMARDPSRAGKTIQEGMYQITYDDMGYAKSARKTSDSAGYVVDGVTYDGNDNVISGGYASGGRVSSGQPAAPTHALDERSYASGVSGSANPAGFGASDASAYLKDLYAQQIAAQLAQLRSTYEQNVAESEAHDDLISDTYQQQRNRAAAQNDLQRMQMNEYGIMRGLNSGTSGQMALAQSAAYQGSLAQLGAQEAQSLSDSALTRRKLDIAYRNAADQAAAEGNAQLTSALYNELVRQEELARQEAAAKQEQENWERSFAYQQEQAGLSNALKANSAANAKPGLTAAQVQAAIKNGITTDNVISAFDYYYGDGAYASLYGGRTGTSTGTGGSPSGTYTAYDNGGLTPAQVQELQRHYGVTADGKWGKNSSAAAGGLSADDAWRTYGQNAAGGVRYSDVKRTIAGYMAQGKYQAAQSVLQSNWDRLTPAQQQEISSLFN